MRRAFALLALVGLVGCQGLGPGSGSAPGEAVGVTTLAAVGDAPSPWTPFKAGERWAYAGVGLGNGSVLVCGGTDGTNPYVENCSQLSVASLQRATLPTFPLPGGRNYGTLTLLPSNRVLLAGGSNATASVLPALLSSPVDSWSDGKAIWEAKEDLPTRRDSYTASLLDSNVVLIGGEVGGIQITSIDVRSEQGDWRNVETGSELFRRVNHTATVLKSQPGSPASVLILGGFGPTGYLKSGFIFSLPNTITPIADMPYGRQLHTATLLDDGSVLVVGGESGTGTGTLGVVQGEALRYDPELKTWEKAGSTVPRKYHAAVRLGADVIIAGGLTLAAPDNAEAFLGGLDDTRFIPNPNTVQRYDPMANAANAWSAAPNLHYARKLLELFALDSTHLLAVGGRNDRQSLPSELFTASALGTAASELEPNACISGHVADGVCCDKDCGGPCHWCNAEGACQEVTGAAPNQRGCSEHLLCSEGKCATQCRANSECEAGYFCNAKGACQATKPIGKACDANGECADGAPCVDGFCCNSSCAGSCGACNQPGLEGHCWPLAEGSVPLPGNGHPSCPPAAQGAEHPGDPQCAASCDGHSTGQCVFVARGSLCTDAACTGEGFQPAGTCDGSGRCELASVTTCAYACDEKGGCLSAQCDDDNCGGYRCDKRTDECRRSCNKSETDCTGGYYCHPSQHRCVRAISLPAGQLPSCGIGREPLRSRHSLLALASLLCAALVRRNRRANHRPSGDQRGSKSRGA